MTSPPNPNLQPPASSLQPASWLTDLPTCASTNIWALEHLNQLIDGSVVFTRRQTGGRGRDGRSWSSPPGVLTASVVVGSPGPDPRAVALIAGLAMVHAIEDRCPGLDLAIKWPNDVMLQGRKLGGVLCEGRSGRIVVGIGLNLAAELPSELATIATSLHQHTTAPDELELLTAIRTYLLEGLGLVIARGLAPVLVQLRGRDLLLGRSLSIVVGESRLEGTGAGIDEAGRLLVVVPDGGIATVDAGHVEAW